MCTGVYVLSNKETVGFLISIGPKGFRAYDVDGRPIGLFEREDAAARAAYQHADAARMANPTE
jgi:hypothetical protein